MRGRGAAGLALVVLLAGGCSGTTTAATNTTTTTTATATQGPKPAGAAPSPISVMVCSHEAAREIDSALGEKATVSQPTWTDHRYSCRYSYPTGSMELSVKELSSWTQTKEYFNSLAAALGRSRDLPGLGQAAFQTTDGSVVVRKDWKVLLVDSTGLPPQFGIPPTSSGDVAVTVGDLILGCWAGD